MNKTLLTLGIVFGILLLSVGVYAAVQFFSSSVDVTVNEALSSTSTPVSISGYAGETQTATFTVDNAANVPLNVRLDWTETTNVNGVTYTTDMSKTVTLASGTNTVSVNFYIDSGSATGTFDGTVDFTRL